MLFFVLGAAMGVWGAQVPAVKQHHGLDEQMLSFALLAAAGGAVLCLLSAGALVERFGVRRCVLAGGRATLLALAAVLQVQQIGPLFALMVLLGAGSALFDVAINTDGNALEMASSRKVMSGLHAMFSLGGMAGALLCAALHRAGVAPAVQLAGAAVVMTGVLWAYVGTLSARLAGAPASHASIAPARRAAVDGRADRPVHGGRRLDVRLERAVHPPGTEHRRGHRRAGFRGLQWRHGGRPAVRRPHPRALRCGGADARLGRAGHRRHGAGADHENAGGGAARLHARRPGPGQRGAGDVRRRRAGAGRGAGARRGGRVVGRLSGLHGRAAADRRAGPLEFADHRAVGGGAVCRADGRGGAPVLARGSQQ
ncbi:MFS transporter [Piscinibacter aquaticus]|uniref:MFS transporter n=1 Tax=Piscinibacter aquaticus TaxID=392597 RepID=A0A5C6U1K6_9BURK|nr:MFS transporter [Piscinibacter aquaticus]